MINQTGLSINLKAVSDKVSDSYYLCVLNFPNNTTCKFILAHTFWRNKEHIMPDGDLLFDPKEAQFTVLTGYKDFDLNNNIPIDKKLNLRCPIFLPDIDIRIDNAYCEYIKYEKKIKISENIFLTFFYDTNNDYIFALITVLCFDEDDINILFTSNNSYYFLENENDFISNDNIYSISNEVFDILFNNIK